MKDLRIKEITGFRKAIEKSFVKLDPHTALTSLAVECRDYHTVENRYGFLCGQYEGSKHAPNFLDGVPRFAALAFLNVLTRGLQALNKPLRDVVKTAGTRDEVKDEQLARVRLCDALKAFTIKQSEVEQFFARRFDGCERPSSSLVDSRSIEMRRAVLAKNAGIFEMISPSFDRYAVAGIKPLRAAMQNKVVKWGLERG